MAPLHMHLSSMRWKAAEGELSGKAVRGSTAAEL